MPRKAPLQIRYDILAEEGTHGIDGDPKERNRFKQSKIDQFSPIYRVHRLAWSDMLPRQKADFSIISTYSHQSGMNRSKKQIIGNAGKKGLCQSISISRKKTCCHGLPGTLAEHGKGQRDKDASYSPTQAFEPSRPLICQVPSNRRPESNSPAVA